MFYLPLAGRTCAQPNLNVPDIKTKQAHIGDFNLHWLEAGDAPTTLVLLHGIGSNAQSWEAQISFFASHYHVIAWNAPGYALSDALPKALAPNPTSYANSLKALLDHAGAKKVVLVGHSLGALIAARFALLYPAALEKLILSAPASGYDCKTNEDFPETLQKRLDDITRLGPKGLAESRAANTLTKAANENLITRAKDAMASVSTQGYQDAVRLLASGHLKQDLSVLSLPFSVMCGTSDQTTPLAKVEVDTNVANRQDLLPLNGAAHASYLEFPDLFNKTLETVLDDNTL